MHVLQLIAVALLAAFPANALAVPILGGKLVVQGSAFSLKPARKSLFLAKEKATDVGTLSDPTVSGATLTVTLTGTTPTTQTYTLDAAGWTAMSSGYRYRAPGNPPELQVRIGKTPGGGASLKVMIEKDAIGLLPPAAGDEALLLLDVTGGERYCVSFGGAAGGTEVRDTATLWKITNATAQPACPTGTPLPACSGELSPCGSCGDGLCVAHPGGSPAFVCASASGNSAGSCSTTSECTAPRECPIPSSTPPCPGGAGQCVVTCNSDAMCEAEAAGFCASVPCLAQQCLIPCY